MIWDKVNRDITSEHKEVVNSEIDFDGVIITKSFTPCIYFLRFYLYSFIQEYQVWTHESISPVRASAIQNEDT